MAFAYPYSFNGSSYISDNFLRGGVMAEARVSTKKVIALILSEDEARWLKNIMQNPLNVSQDPSDEDVRDRNFRHNIFNSLDSVGV
jgi:hypothetical protein